MAGFPSNVAGPGIAKGLHHCSTSNIQFLFIRISSACSTCKLPICKQNHASVLVTIPCECVDTRRHRQTEAHEASRASCVQTRRFAGTPEGLCRDVLYLMIRAGFHSLIDHENLIVYHVVQGATSPLPHRSFPAHPSSSSTEVVGHLHLFLLAILSLLRCLQRVTAHLLLWNVRSVTKPSVAVSI